MRKILFVVLLASSILNSLCQQSSKADIDKYIKIIRENIFNDYKGMFREPKGALKFHYITPGSQAYATQLWDWDSWLTSIALQQIVNERGIEQEKSNVIKYEQGCVLNFLNFCAYGWIPIVVNEDQRNA